MALFLAQHGLSLPKDKDPEKGLSDKGLEDTLRIAEVAKHYAISVSKIVHSDKKRSIQTAAIFQKNLQPKTKMEQISGINPNDDVKALVDVIDNTTGLLIVGHLPFLEKLVAYLTTGNEDKRIYRFQNSGIVCLDLDQDQAQDHDQAQDNHDWYIKWTLNPNIN